MTKSALNLAKAALNPSKLVLSSRRPPLRFRGFTLIEVLVALTIAAVALMAALRATGSMAQSSEELRLRTLAQWSAENQLSELRIQALVPGLGAQTKACPQADVELTCRIEVFAMPAQAFRRVEVSVFGGRDNHRLARLIGFPSQVGQ